MFLPVHYDEEIEEKTNAKHDPTNNHEKPEYDVGDMNNSKRININVTDILSIHTLKDANKHYAERIRMSSDPNDNMQTVNGMETSNELMHYRCVYNNGSVH